MNSSTVNTQRAFIGLGSNLQQPITQVTEALRELEQLPNTTLVGHSSLYQSEPVGPPGQDDYINAVAALETSLEPLALLDQLQAIEQQHQRVRETHWGPRTLDLDLLLYGQQHIQLDRLTVPHPYLSERNFVLQPLSEVHTNVTLPDGTAVATLALQVGNQGLQRLTDLHPMTIAD